MGGPPAVTLVIPGVGLDGPIAAGLSALLVLGLVGLFAFGAVQTPADLIYTLPLLLCSIALAVLCMTRPPLATHAPVLRWDGRNWFRSFQDGDGVCEVEYVMDLQVCMLLKLRTLEGVREWIWLQRKDHHKNWYPLRRALIFDAVPADDWPVAVRRE